MGSPNVLLALAGAIVIAIVVSVCVAGVSLVKLAKGKPVGLAAYFTFLLLLPASFSMFAYLPTHVEKTLNTVTDVPLPTVTEAAAALHKTLSVVDLHADSLMWAQNRNLNLRSGIGHVDVPRLLEGNVAVQAFTIVSQVPFQQNFESNDNKTDMFSVLAPLSRWPLKTWGSPLQRAVFQCRQLFATAAASDDRLRVVLTSQDLTDYLSERAATPPHTITAGFLGVEGLMPLEGNLANLDVLFEAGVRMAAPAHFHDNQVGGSAHGIAKYGLTDLGKQVVKRMEELRMVLDLAHSSEAVLDDALAIATRPVVVSHTGVRGTCDRTRNLADRHVVGVAKTGGVVAIAYFPEAVCGTSVDHVVAAIVHVCNLVGCDHVALGSDYDGTVKVPFDTSKLDVITQALLSSPDIPDDAIPGIMGDNAIRVLKATLP